MNPEPPDETPNEPSSPACALHKLDESYLGYASPQEVQIALAAFVLGDEGAAAQLESLIPRLQDLKMRADLRNLLQDGPNRIAMAIALMKTPQPE